MKRLHLKLKQKVNGIFLILTIAYLILMIVAGFQLVSKSITQYLRVNSQTLVKGIGENLNAAFQSISNMSLLIMNDEHVIGYLRTGDEQQAVNAVTSLKKIQASYYDVYSIFLIMKNNSYISTGRDITNVNRAVFEQGLWKEELDARRGSYMVRLQGGDIFAMNTGEEIVSFMRRIYDHDTQLPIGYLAVNMPASVFADSLNKLMYTTENFSVMDLDARSMGNRTLVPKLKELLGNEEIYTQRAEYRTGGIQILTTMLCAADSLRIGIIEDISYFTLLREQVNILWAGFALITIAGIIILGTFITRTVTDPIEQLCRSMNEVKEGRLKRVSMKLPDDEIGMLKDTYNNMLVEANKLIEDLVEKEKNVKNLELEMLYEQMKPHFLYNTIDTICYMVFEKPPAEVYDALETLGDFYRKSLSKGKTTITLQDEIEIVKDYLTLQRLRFGDIFHDVYEIDADISRIYVPKLIIQPLVENSINHGIRPKGEAGTIWFQIRDLGGQIEISVKDNGVGMTESEIKECLYKDNGRSFGFKGTAERLKNYYQTDNVCVVRSKKGEYFQVIITIPKQETVP